MRLLLIGGTEFVGRHIVEAAVAAGHEVTVFHRGRTEPADLPPVEHVHGDRDGGLDALAGRAFDAVVDVCGYRPRVVRLSVDALAGSVDRYCFISSESVYAQPLPPVVTEDAPLATLGAAEGPGGWYGPLKVLCERVVEAVFGERALLVRPGYVAGPHDPTDRFTSWVRRVARGGAILAPGDGSDHVQLIDARDLGAFVVRLLETGASGPYNADGPPMTMAEFLAAIARSCGTAPRVVWLPAPVVRERHLEEAFPLWEGPTLGGSVMDTSRARAAGLVNRPLEETAADTLAWDRARGLPPLTAGLDPEREARLLAELG
jgi:2'-hydroxyisoflavone reductase